MFINGDTSKNPIIKLLSRIFNTVSGFPWIDKTANQVRAQVTGTISTVTTVTTTTTLTNIGSFPGDHLQRQASMTSWAQVVRSRIT